MNEAHVPDASYRGVKSDILTTALTTHDGTKLSPKEDKFITLYIKYSDAGRAAEEAGYLIRAERKDKKLAYAKKGKSILQKDYIKAEIAARADEYRDSQIADTKEILIYLTNVMRGEIKDQFGIDASLQERTNAAKELNRRLRELETGDSVNGNGGKEIHLVLRRE